MAMKVKTGMSGTGKGRWCPRAEAKNVCRKARRSESREAIAAGLEPDNRPISRRVKVSLPEVASLDFDGFIDRLESLALGGRDDDFLGLDDMEFTPKCVRDGLIEIEVTGRPIAA